MAEKDDAPKGDDDAAPKGKGSGLGRKLGPFTVGAWLAIGAAGVALGLLIRRSSLFGGGSSADLTPLPEGEETFDPGMPGYQPAGPYAGANNSAVVIGGPARATTNDEWVRFAVEGLSAGSDNISPSKSQPALMRFLEGNPVTQQQADIVALAIRRYGAPPEGAPPLEVIPNETDTGAPDYRKMSTAQVLAEGRRLMEVGDGVYTDAAEEVYERIMARSFSVNSLARGEPFDLYVLRLVIGRHPELVPTAENAAALQGRASGALDAPMDDVLPESPTAPQGRALRRT